MLSWNCGSDKGLKPSEISTAELWAVNHHPRNRGTHELSPHPPFLDSGLWILKDVLAPFFFLFCVTSSNKCAVSQFWWKKKCSGTPVSHCSSVVVEVAWEERPDFGSSFMRCKWLASDWLTALSVTVIIPIQFTERETHTEKVKTRERQREIVQERGREKENHWPPWILRRAANRL